MQLTTVENIVENKEMFLIMFSLLLKNGVFSFYWCFIVPYSVKT